MRSGGLRRSKPSWRRREQPWSGYGWHGAGGQNDGTSRFGARAVRLVRITEQPVPPAGELSGSDRATRCPTEELRDGPCDDWIAFSEAAWKIEERLNVSVGHSQVTLRNLCASGEVRSVQIKYDIDPSDPYDPDATPVEVKMVRPSEWRTTEVDLDGVIEVSEGDLEYWLRQQGAPPPAVIERQLMPRPQWNQKGDC
jgi:hypothetical protein